MTKLSLNFSFVTFFCLLSFQTNSHAQTAKCSSIFFEETSILPSAFNVRLNFSVGSRGVTRIESKHLTADQFRMLDEAVRSLDEVRTEYSKQNLFCPPSMDLTIFPIGRTANNEWRETTKTLYFSYNLTNEARSELIPYSISKAISLHEFAHSMFYATSKKSSKAFLEFLNTTWEIRRLLDEADLIKSRLNEIKLQNPDLKRSALSELPEYQDLQDRSFEIQGKIQTVRNNMFGPDSSDLYRYYENAITGLNELFADMVAVTITGTPDAMARAVSFSTDSEFTISTRKFRDFSNQISVKDWDNVWDGFSLHHLFAPARGVIGRKLFTVPELSKKERVRRSAIIYSKIILSIEEILSSRKPMKASELNQLLIDHIEGAL